MQDPIGQLFVIKIGHAPWLLTPPNEPRGILVIAQHVDKEIGDVHLLIVKENQMILCISQEYLVRQSHFIANDSHKFLTRPLGSSAKQKRRCYWSFDHGYIIEVLNDFVEPVEPTENE